MSEKIDSQKLAEHLSTLASLLEAEAIRANALGIPMRKNLAREAKEARELANRLWNAGIQIALDENAPDSRAVRSSDADDDRETLGRLALVQ